MSRRLSHTQRSNSPNTRRSWLACPASLAIVLSLAAGCGGAGLTESPATAPSEGSAPRQGSEPANGSGYACTPQFAAHSPGCPGYVGDDVTTPGQPDAPLPPHEPGCYRASDGCYVTNPSDPPPRSDPPPSDPPPSEAPSEPEEPSE